MKYALPVVAVVTSVGLGFAGVTAAQTASTGTAPNIAAGNQMFVRGERPAVVGTVTAVSGNTITVASKNPMGASAAAETYTVDASNAKILKSGTPGTAPTESAVSEVVVGDRVAIRGTVSGTSVSATEIIDGVMFKAFRGGRGPGVRGTVTAVSGNTVTLSGENGTTYTIDAGSATVDKLTTITAAQIAVGDKLGVQGTVSGTSVTAEHIMDGMPMHEAHATNN